MLTPAACLFDQRATVFIFSCEVKAADDILFLCPNIYL